MITTSVSRCRNEFILFAEALYNVPLILPLQIKKQITFLIEKLRHVLVEVTVAICKQQTHNDLVYQINLQFTITNYNKQFTIIC